MARICSGVSHETHWNGVCGLGTKVLTPAFSLALHADHFAALGDDPLAQVGDRLHILQRLTGMADHEVELDGGPAAAVDLAGGVDDLLVGDELVDDAAHPLGGGLGGQGKPAGAADP